MKKSKKNDYEISPYWTNRAIKELKKLYNSWNWPMLPGTFPMQLNDGEPNIQKTGMQAALYLGIKLGIKIERSNKKHE